jgi:hypothetical protein
MPRGNGGGGGNGTRRGSRSRNRTENGRGTRRGSRSRNRNVSRNRPVTRSWGRFLESMGRSRRGSRSTSKNRNGPVTRSLGRSTNININGDGNSNRFNPIIASAEEPIRPAAAEEEQGYNTDNTDEYSNGYASGFEGYMVPTGVRMSSSSLARSSSVPLTRSSSVPLTRASSVGQKYELSSVTGTDLVLSQTLERFVTVSPGEVEAVEAQATNSLGGSDDSQGSLIRYLSVANHGQSLLRFVLYTSDRLMAARFTERSPIQLLYNSQQNVPLDVVYIVHPNIKSDQIAGIRRRLPESVQHLSQTFTEGQIENALTKPNCFLLTVELDNERRQRHDQLTPTPTGPIFGVLCCSEELATVESSRFVDDHGDPLITFESHVNDHYIYVHLFTYLSDRTVGQNFFTGSLMLEGLYNLFNPIEGENHRIIYLEAITVPATLQFYDRFGMERLNQMRLPSRIIINGILTDLVYFDPFKGYVVPDEIPYVLTNHSQIELAAIAARDQRHARQDVTQQRLMAQVQATPLRHVTDEERLDLENALDVFRRDRARSNRYGPFPLIRPPAP